MSGINAGLPLSVTDIIYPYPVNEAGQQESASEDLISYEALELQEKEQLFVAVECGYSSVVIQKLVTDPNRIYIVNNDVRKDTLLHIAAMNAQREVLKVLVGYGAVVNVINANGDTPLHCAAFVKRSVRYLVEHGAMNSLNVRNNKGYSPLDISIIVGSYKDARYLLSVGARYDYVDEKGNTPLHYAAEIVRNDKESEKIAKLFLEKGLSATKKNNEGLIPFEIAAKNFNVGAAEAMLESSQRADIKKYLERKHNWETVNHASAWESIDHPVIKQMVKDLIQER